MPDTPWLGPTYPLASKPASVQRTVNLMPLPLEPGNERAGWVYKDVPGLSLVTTTNAPAYPPYQSLPFNPSIAGRWNCELLVHFDQTIPGQWKDYSQRKHILTPSTLIDVTQGGIHSISSLAADVGEFSGGAHFSQANPGDVIGPSGAYADTATNIAVDTETVLSFNEFFMSAWVRFGPTSTPSGPLARQFTILSSRNGANFPYIAGWNFALGCYIDSTTVYPVWNSVYGPNGSQVACSVQGNGGPNQVVQNTWTHVAVSRKVTGANDTITTFTNGLVSGTASLATGIGLNLGGNGMLIGCDRHGPDYPGDNRHTHGFDGWIDEVFLIMGAGTGISAPFTPPTGPYLL